MTDVYWNKLWDKRFNKFIKDVVKPLFETDFKKDILELVKSKLVIDLKINEKIIDELEFNEDQYIEYLKVKFYDLILVEKLDQKDKSNVSKIIIILTKTLIAYQFEKFHDKLKSWNLMEYKKDHVGNEYPYYDEDEIKNWGLIKK